MQHPDAQVVRIRHHSSRARVFSVMGCVLLAAACVSVRETHARTTFEDARDLTTVAEADTLGSHRIPVVTPDLLEDPLEKRRRLEPQAPQRMPYRAPMGCALRSVVLPGWGQDALGDRAGGFLYATWWGLAVTMTAGYFQLPFIEDEDFSKLAGGVLWGLGSVVSGLDAYRSAQEINRENGYDMFELGARPPSGARIVLLHKRF